MNTSTSATARSDESRWHSVLQRWPSALGLAAAAWQLATGADPEGVAIV